MVILVPPAFGPMEGSSEWTLGSWGEGKGFGSGCRPVETELDGEWWWPTYHIGELFPGPAFLGDIHGYHV